jgi:hypothetical protein
MIVIGGVIGLVILLLILGALVENDYPGWSTLMAVSFALFMGMRGVTVPETWLWIKTNPGILVLAGMAYLALVQVGPVSMVVYVRKNSKLEAKELRYRTTNRSEYWSKNIRAGS